MASQVPIFVIAGAIAWVNFGTANSGDLLPGATQFVPAFTRLCDMDMVEDEEHYSAAIELGDTQKIHIASCYRKQGETLLIAKEIAGFLGMELRIDDRIK